MIEYSSLRLQQIPSLFRSKTVLLVTLLLAATLRVWHVLSLRDLPLFNELTLDSMTYDQLARSFAAGNWMGPERAFFQDPLYPYILAVIYRLFGHDMLVVRLVQAGVGAATCGLLYVIGRRIGGRAVGTVAALIMALYAPAVFSDIEIDKTVFGLFFVTAALMLVLRRTPCSVLCSGICLGLAAQTRGNLMLMVPMGALFLLVSPEVTKEPSPCSPDEEGGRLSRLVAGAKYALLFLLGCMVVFGPLLWRNHHVSGEWFTSSAGINVYTGNNPSNSSGGFETVPFVRANPLYEEDDFRAEAERLTGRKMSSREVSSYWLHASLDHMAQHPAFAATVFLKKIVLICSDVELPDGWCMYFLSRYSPALRLPLPGMAFLFPLAVLGAVVSVRKRQDVRLLAGYVALYAATLFLFFVFSRYRMYLVPPMTVLASLGLQWLWRQLTARNVRRLAVGVASCLVLGFFSYSGASSFNVVQGPWLHNFWHLADLYENQGQYDQALELVYEAQQQYPESYETVCRIGKYHQLKGEYAQAIEFNTRCLELNGENKGSWYSLGVSYEATGDRELAVTCYQRELIIQPGHQPSLERLNRLADGGAVVK